MNNPRKFRICWRSKLTGARGQGKGVFTKEIAEETVDKLNLEHFLVLEHWIEEA